MTNKTWSLVPLPVRRQTNSCKYVIGSKICAPMAHMI